MVVAYHSGLSIADNGFLGVDIFFVISGYLMASIYSQSSAGEFYVARLKRLYPGLIGVSSICLLLGVVALTPFELKELAKEVVLGISGLSNIAFWNDDNYFAQGRFRPMLHFWTLAVELQFYLTFPVLCKVTKNKLSRWLFLCIVSFILSQAILFKSAKSAFFLLPGRFWEFALGIIAALILSTMTASKNKQIQPIRIIGWIGLLFSQLFWIDPNSVLGLHGHPGFAALVTCISTAAILITSPGLMFMRSIPARICLSLGAASYLIYLIHYPILIALNYRPFASSSTKLTSDTQAILFVTFVGLIGVIGFRKFENPILKKKISWKPLISGYVLLIILAIVSVPTNQAISNTNEIAISASLENRADYRCGKIFRILHPNSKMCDLSGPESSDEVSVLLLGNSHSDMIKSELKNMSRKYNFELRFWADNNPFNGKFQNVDLIAKEILRNNITDVVLHSSYLYPSASEIERLIYQTNGQKVKVYMLESIPTYTESVPVLANESRKTHSSPNAFLNPESKNVAKFYSSITSSRFAYIHTQQVFCNPLCKWKNKQGQLFYFDSNHLTLVGAHQLNPLLNELSMRIVSKK